MNFKLKQLIAGLVAVLALSLGGTSMAAAAQFTAAAGSIYPVKYNGSGSAEYGYMTTEAGNTECSSGSASATLSEASSTLSIAGGVSGCKAFGFLSATVSPNGCSSLVHVKEKLGADTYSATVDLLCPAEQAVTMVVSTCEVKMFAQEGKGTVKLTDDTVNGTVKVDLISSNFKYTVTKDGIGCTYNGTGERTGGTFTELKTGVISIKGTEIHVG